jgi:hypothetical protein
MPRPRKNAAEGPPKPDSRAYAGFKIMVKYVRALRLFALKNGQDASIALEGILEERLSQELEDLKKWQDANYELNAAKNNKRGPKPKEDSRSSPKGPANP